MVIDCRVLLDTLMEQGIYLFEKDGRLGFKTAQGASLSKQHKQQIQAAKPQLIRFLAASADQHQRKDTPPPLVANADPGLSKLSFAQQQIWSIQSSTPQSTDYHLNFVFEVAGKFDISAAETSFQTIIQRHEVLRSIFIEHQGQVLQQVRPSGAAFKIQQTNICAGEWQSKLAEHLALQRALPFDLQVDLMLRCNYYICTNDDGLAMSCGRGVLLLTLHHIAADGWSMDILFREFQRYYRQAVQNLPISVEPLPIQYRDYANWQRKWYQQDQLENALQHWQQQLINLPLCHGLATTQPRPEIKQSKAGHVTEHLDGTIAKRLEQHCREQTMTPFMLLHGALVLVLARHSQRPDIAIGVPSANRTQKVLTELIGYFVNILLLRVNTSFADLQAYFAQVKQVHLAAQANQDVPFEMLVERLKVPRDLSYNPLFQIMLITDTDYSLAEQQSNINLPEVSIRPGVSMDHQVKFDLEIQLVFNLQGITLDWSYDQALFTQAQVESLVQDLGAVLTHLASLTSLAAHSVAQAMYPLGGSEALIASNQRLSNLPEKLDSRDLFVAFDHRVARSGKQQALVTAQGTLSFLALDQYVYACMCALHHDHFEPGHKAKIITDCLMVRVIQILAVMRCGGYWSVVDKAKVSMISEDDAYLMPDVDFTSLSGVSCQSRHYPCYQFNQDELNCESASEFGLNYTALLQRGMALTRRWVNVTDCTWGVLNPTINSVLNIIALLLQGWSVFELHGKQHAPQVDVLEGNLADLLRFTHKFKPLNLSNIFIIDGSSICPVAVHQLIALYNQNISVVHGLFSAHGDCFSTALVSSKTSQSFMLEPGYRGQLVDELGQLRPAMTTGYLCLTHVPYHLIKTPLTTDLRVRQSNGQQFELVTEAVEWGPQGAKILAILYAMQDIVLCRLVNQVVTEEKSSIDVYLEIVERADPMSVAESVAKQLSTSLGIHSVRQVSVVWSCTALDALGSANNRREVVLLGQTQLKSSAQLAVEDQLMTIWRLLLPNQALHLTPEANIFELGATSMLMILALSKIHSELGVTVEVAAIIHNPTIEKLAAYLCRMRQTENAAEPSLLVPLSTKAQSTESAIYWIHPYGGGVQQYQLIADQLPLNSYGLQAPFQAGFDRVYDGWIALIEDYAQQIHQHAQCNSIILAGFSLGGVIAALLEQVLHAKGIEVRAIWLLDSYVESFSAIRSASLADRLRYILSFVDVDPHWVDDCMIDGATSSATIAAVATRLAAEKNIAPSFATGYLNFHNALGSYEGGSLLEDMDLSTVPVCLIVNAAAQQCESNQQAWLGRCQLALQSHLIPYDHNNFLNLEAITVIKQLLLADLKRIGVASAVQG